MLEAAARTIQKIYRGKLARRQMHARLHALEHEVEEAIEEGVKEMFGFVMGSKYITKNTKRPEKLPVRHICKELVQARLWRGWVLFLIVFVCAAPQKHSTPPLLTNTRAEPGLLPPQFVHGAAAAAVGFGLRLRNVLHVPRGGGE